MSSAARPARWVRAVRASLGSRAPAPPGSDPARVAAYARAVAPAGTPELVAVVVGPDAPAAPFPVPLEAFGTAQGRVFVLGGRADEVPTGLPWPVEHVDAAERLHRILAALGPVDVLVESGPLRKSAKRRLLHWLFGHVRPGGVYVIADAAAAYDEEHADVTGENAVQLALRMVQLGLAPEMFPQASDQDRAFASTVAGVRLADDLVALERRGEVSVKVRHTELEEILQRRPGPSWSRVLRRVRAEPVVSTAVGSVNHETRRRELYPSRFEVPGLLVREYDDVLCWPGQLATRGDLVLPDAFRLWRRPMQRHSRLTDTSHYFVRSPAAEQPARRLEGQYYYADSEYPDHFGHFMTETLGRLWAWPEAKERNPGLKLLMSEVVPYQADLLAAYGIARSDVVTFDGPVLVESLVSAGPAFHIGSYVSPALMEQTYARLRAGMPVVPSPAGDKVFLTRERGLWRECLNAGWVEDFFAARGYAVLRPETYPVAEQAALFREARVVAGFVGSQLYSQVFHPGRLDVIGFVNLSYTSNNEYLLATALGHTLHQFWCPERPGTRAYDSTGRPLVAMHTDYAFDLDADLEALTTLVDRLG